MRLTCGVVLSLCVTTLATGAAGISHAAPREGTLGPDLFLAIGKRDLAAVKQLLARGADPNARNFLQMTPLMFAAASGQPEVASALLSAGAELNTECPLGTALTFAGLGESAAAERFLIARGAATNPRRPDGITPLMLAARAGHQEVVQTLIARNVDVNTPDNEGATPLMWAARFGRTEVARLLLAKGARVDVADSQGWTPLMAAAAAGHTGCAEVLIEHSADLNAVDKQGRTPLMLAASYGDQPALVRALIARGARTELRDGGGRTAMALAAARGSTAVETALREAGTETLAVSEPPKRSVEQAAQAGLDRLQHSMRVFAERTGCASCHHEGLGRMATGLARERGLAVDEKLEQAQVERIYGMLGEMRPLLQKALKEPAETKNIPSVEVNEYVPSMVYLLAGLEAHRKPADGALAEAVTILGRQQATDGRWPFVFHRVPMQSSEFTTTALALHAMRAFAPKERAGEVERRADRAKSWLLATPASTSEDMAFRLMGLQAAGASREERQKAAEALRGAQREDGGWAQLESMPSDAYATGQALYALRRAGEMPASDPVYQRGVQFLLRTQEEDGSWFVAKRAIPANNYFDAEFPHGHSQYSSFAGTCWATMALMLATEMPPTGVQAATVPRS